MLSDSETSWRVLVALLVHDGASVERCLSSLARLNPGAHSTDILVLDDTSPEHGWSARCHDLSTDLGFEYYRTPRVLGIPRVVNTGMLCAIESGYDAVVLLDDHTHIPANTIPTLIDPLTKDSSASSAIPWSNHSSGYSPANLDAEQILQVPGLVDWISDRLSEEFGCLTMPVPSGMGPCIALPTTVIQDVGMMDPIFSQGSFMEIDWCLRSHELGYRSVLVPSCFAHHTGSITTQVADTTPQDGRALQAERAIIDERYPLSRAQLLEFFSSSIMSEMRVRANMRIILCAAREKGYRVEVGRLDKFEEDTDVIGFRIDPTGQQSAITATYQGFEASFAVGDGGVLSTVQEIVGEAPREIRVFERGRFAQDLEAAVSGTACVIRHSPYREGVF